MAATPHPTPPRRRDRPRRQPQPPPFHRAQPPRSAPPATLRPRPLEPPPRAAPSRSFARPAQRRGRRARSGTAPRPPTSAQPRRRSRRSASRRSRHRRAIPTDSCGRCPRRRRRSPPTVVVLSERVDGAINERGEAHRPLPDGGCGSGVGAHLARGWRRHIRGGWPVEFGAGPRSLRPRVRAPPLGRPTRAIDARDQRQWRAADGPQNADRRALRRGGVSSAHGAHGQRPCGSSTKSSTTPSKTPS
jgi:hypothetical protein